MISSGRLLHYIQVRLITFHPDEIRHVLMERVYCLPISFFVLIGGADTVRLSRVASLDLDH